MPVFAPLRQTNDRKKKDSQSQRIHDPSCLLDAVDWLSLLGIAFGSPPVRQLSSLHSLHLLCLAHPSPLHFHLPGTLCSTDAPTATAFFFFFSCMQARFAVLGSPRPAMLPQWVPVSWRCWLLCVVPLHTPPSHYVDSSSILPRLWSFGLPGQAQEASAGLPHAAFFRWLFSSQSIRAYTRRDGAQNGGAPAGVAVEQGSRL